MVQEAAQLMGRQVKNIITLAVTLLIIGGLAGVYIWQTSRPEPEPEPAAPAREPAIILIDREEADVVSVRFTAQGHDMTMLSREDEFGAIEWVIADAPDTPIAQFSAREMIRSAYYLSVEEKLFDAVDNPAEYGVGNNIKAEVTYKDGTTAVIHVGNMTPSHERFYMMLEGDPGLYLLFTYFGNRYLYTADDLIDKNTPPIDVNGAEYLLINQRGKKPVEFIYTGTEEEKEEYYEQFGTIVMDMVSPYPGRELYYSSIERLVIDPFNEKFRLGKLIELSAEDLSLYGLDEPSLEFHWIGAFENETMHLLFGDKTEDDLIYVMQKERPEVFTVTFESVSSLFDINPMQFIDRFIALMDIRFCERIEIIYPSVPSRNYNIVINNEVVTEDERERDTISPVINGREVDDSAFRSTYRLLIGLSSDVEIDPFEPEGEPEFTIIYRMTNGPDTYIRFFVYDANFYAMSRDNEICMFVTSRQSTEQFFKSLEGLTGL
jgi:hypothetical protein